MRKLRLLFLTVAMLSMLTIGVQANSDSTPAPNVKMGNTIFKSMAVPDASDNVIIYMEDFARNRTTKMTTHSITYTSKKCDTLSLTYYIQEKGENGGWVTVSTFTYSESNADTIIAAPTYYGVEEGKTYRTRVFRSAFVDGIEYSDINGSLEVTIK